jgi:hypothetical protein
MPRPVRWPFGRVFFLPERLPEALVTCDVMLSFLMTRQKARKRVEELKTDDEKKQSSASKRVRHTSSGTKCARPRLDLCALLPA